MKNTKKHLLAHHAEDLRGSGLTDETIEACGFYSETEYSKLSALLGGRRLPKRSAPALVLPFHGPDGSNGYARVKPDTPRTLKGKPVRYESPGGRANEVFIPPGTFEAIADPDIALAITEGEKKAARVDQEGFPCLGLVGVFGWKTAKAERLLSVLDQIEWKGRTVWIIFDSDIGGNENIQDAESRLAAQLVNRGAKVRCVRLPDLPDGEKCGADDFLVHHDLGEFRKLLDSAIEPEPIDAATAKVAGNTLDPATEAAEFLKRAQRDGVSRLRYHRGSFLYWKRGAYRTINTDQARGELIRHLNQHTHSLSSAVVTNIVDQLKAQAELSPDTEAPAWLTADAPYPAAELLVARNGCFHLPSIVTGEPSRLDPTPRLFTTSALDFDFALDAPKPEAFLYFLGQLWPDDPEAVASLQQWFGYCLTANTSMQKILFLVGPKRSGKGTIARVQRALVGPQNVVGPTLAGLSTNFGLAPLVGKSVAIVSDARLSGRTDKAIVMERLLSISGEDALTIDRKYGSAVTVKLPTRLMLLSNELPRFSDASGALASRMIFLELNRSFYGEEDPGLTDRLLGELPGILLWAIGGWQSLRENGRFIEPASTKALSVEMADLASPVAEFVRTCCELGPDCRVSRSQLYDAYSDWCEDRGKAYCDDQAGFGRNLRAAVSGIRDTQTRIEGKAVRFYVGINLLPGW